ARSRRIRIQRWRSHVHSLARRDVILASGHFNVDKVINTQAIYEDTPRMLSRIAGERKNGSRHARIFRAAIHSAHQGNVGPLVDFLCADHPLGPEQKKELAELIVLQADLVRHRTPRRRGRPPAGTFSDTWYRRNAVERIRSMAKKERIPLQ